MTLLSNGFQDRLVMTASIPLRIRCGASVGRDKYDTTKARVCQEISARKAGGGTGRDGKVTRGAARTAFRWILMSYEPALRLSLPRRRKRTTAAIQRIVGIACTEITDAQPEEDAATDVSSFDVSGAVRAVFVHKAT